ncbi:MAG: hypothetical protein QRY72_04890 [Candidatus Rhabdochlamydia sp.]
MLREISYLIPAELPAIVRVLKYALRKSSSLSQLDQKIVTASATALAFIYLLNRWSHLRNNVNFLIGVISIMYPQISSYLIAYTVMRAEFHSLKKRAVFSVDWMAAAVKTVGFMCLLSTPAVTFREKLWLNGRC